MEKRRKKKKIQDLLTRFSVSLVFSLRDPLFRAYGGDARL